MTNRFDRSLRRRVNRQIKLVKSTMTKAIILLISFIILTIIVVETSSFSCYVCNGVDCLPNEGNIRECKNEATNKCFYLTGNNTNMVRGCFEEQDKNYPNCWEHLVNTCNTCNTTLCNNNPPTQNNTVVCFQCAPSSPRCRDPVLREHNMRPCRRFMYTDRPR